MAQTGGMIALAPRAADAARLVIDHPDAEPAEQMHLTLTYLGDDVTDWTEDQRETVLTAARKAAGGLGPIEARVMGHATFNPDGGPDGDTDPCAVYLISDSAELTPLRDELSPAADTEQHKPFLPHITAGYGVAADQLSHTGPIVFDRLRVALADVNIYLPLGQPANSESPGEPDPDDTEIKRIPATMKCKFCSKQATKAVIWAEGKAYQPSCDDHVDKVKGSIEGEVDTVRDLADMRRRASEKDAGVRDVEEKARVASEAGERRYGLPIGTELGQARDARAAQAQRNPRAYDQYETLVNANPRRYREMLDGLSAADLKSLAAIAYSFRSSNPTVVQARIAVAGALRRMGLDVNDYGGLGKSTTRRGRRAPRKPAGKDSVRLGDVSDAEWNRLRAQGWKGRPGDREERLYRPGSKASEDDVDNVEVKRTTTKPWEKGKVQKAGHTLDKSDDGDTYPIKTIGDLAAAVKKAKGIKDEEKRDKIRAHIRKEATRLKAPNMIPKEWASGSGGSDKDKGNLAPPFKKKGEKAVALDLDTVDPVVLAGAIEAKAMSPHPGAVKLRNYWAHGAGRKKWRPGTGGDFKRLRSRLAKHVPPHMLNGLTANIHKLATGQWPGRGRHHGKAADIDGYEVKAGMVRLSPRDLSEADHLDEDPDATVLALDRYADMGDEVTSEEAYEQALADEVDWELEIDGTVTRAHQDDEGDEGDDAAGDSGPDTPDPTMAGLAALDALFADTSDDENEDRTPVGAGAMGWRSGRT